MKIVDIITRRDPLELAEAVERFINDDKNMVDEVHYMYATGDYIAFIHYVKSKDWEY